MSKNFDFYKFLELYNLKFVDAEIANALGFSTSHIRRYRVGCGLPPNGKCGRRKNNERNATYVCPAGQKVTVGLGKFKKAPSNLKLKGRMLHFRECYKCQKGVPYSYFCINLGRYKGPVEKVEYYCELNLEGMDI